MKDELLDIDALLSHVAAELSYPKPDLEKARTDLSAARDKLLNLAEGLEAPIVNN